MERVNLKAVKRESAGKSSAKKLRKDGMVPCIVYGEDAEPESIAVNLRELNKVYKGKFGQNTLIELNGEELVMGYQIETDAISQEIIHVDFLRVGKGKPVKAIVPLVLTGKAPGVRMGGILIQKRDEVTVEAVPSAIPEKIEVDISGLKVDDSFKLDELNVGEGVTVVHVGESTIVRVAAPKNAVIDEDEEEGAEEGEEGAEETTASAEDGENAGDEG